MKTETAMILDDLVQRRPEIKPCHAALQQAFEIILESQRGGGQLLVCGNGGSAADSLHIVGELLKSFNLPRPLPNDLQAKLEGQDAEIGGYLAKALQSPIRAVSLVSEASLITAVLNDTAADVIFAQQVLGHGKPGDVLLGITTSGNSANVLNAAITAKAIGMKVISLTGPNGGKVKAVADCAILAPGATTPLIQEAHLPIYHALCLMLENEMFGCDCGAGS